MFSPVRADFPALADLTYLNLGTHGLMPEPALRRYLTAVARYEREGYFAHYDLLATRERVRARLAALIGASPATLALTGNASDGVNLVAAGIAWRPDDEVVISDQEHPAVENPFAYLAFRGRLRLRRFSLAMDPQTTLDNLAAALTPRTRLLAVSVVSSQTGARLPPVEAVALAHAHGVEVLLDAAQALGQLPLDVTALQCDYLVSNGHKWLLGPKGVGLLYVRPDRLEGLTPAHVGAGSLREDAPVPTLQPTAARFEFGTRALPLWEGMDATLDWWEERDAAALQAHMAALAAELKSRVAAHPRLRLLSPGPWEHSSALVSFQVADRLDAVELLRALWAQRVLVRAVPERNALRVSTGPFNDSGDLDRLFAALERI
ncbi:MAG: aminotransferase class V-fold PLP-dependent enzyme [Oscillochloridaceae bacterium]|nr:aminotransferase class V-fold PLP-dependent enzyme [Chloroflexaceae bacterium]MDW8390608.1 aminotransferase class V-fold PLP-dependent enzyme [Oscillochloridaceae bacterium]